MVFAPRASASALLLSAACSSFLPAVGAPSQQEKGPLRVLLLQGGRPWTARSTAAFIKAAGAAVTTIDSAGLAGLGASPIRMHLMDEFEPEPDDKITPTFGRLHEFDVIVIGGIFRKDQEALFTPERIGALKTFVRNGGGLLMTKEAPVTLEELLPVTFSEDSLPAEVRTCRKLNDILRVFPDRFPCFGKGRGILPKEGAAVLTEYVDDSGRARGAHIAAHTYGKGRVVYWDDDWRRKGGFRQLDSWTYFGSMLVQITAYAGRAELDPEADRVLYRPLPTVPQIPTETARVRIRPPSFGERQFDDPASVQEMGGVLSVAFANGVALTVTRDPLQIDVRLPGIASPVISGLEPPVFATSLPSPEESWDTTTAEAVPTADATIPPSSLVSTKWILADCLKLERGGVALRLASSEKTHEGMKMLWRFEPGEFTVDGRTFQGVAENIRVDGTDARVEMVRFEAPVRIGDELTGSEAWRMSCYSAPRGFVKVPFEETTEATTRRWSHFASGQAFNWLQSPHGIFCQMMDRPAASNGEIKHAAGKSHLHVATQVLLGRRFAPLDTPRVWHLFSPTPPEGPNAWLAFQQYTRIRYCGQTGITVPRPLPTAQHTNTCGAEQIDQVIEAAGRLGFKRYMLPLCPSSMYAIFSDKLAPMYAKLLEAGLRPKPWSPGAYAQGFDDPMAKAHPEWLAHKRDGKPLLWMNGHDPIYDWTIPACRQWYAELFDKAIAIGMRDIYLDMAGAQTGVVNFRLAEPRPGMAGAVEIYRALSDRDVSFGVEGQCPLALDNFWYRKRLYVDHSGMEWVFTGMGCYTNAPDHMAMDYFRLGMHYAFFVNTISGYACGMETVPGEIRRTEEAGRCNKMFNRALELMPRPFVRVTPFGSVWCDADAAAAFVWSPVSVLEVNLPAEWEAAELHTIDGDVQVLQDGRIPGLPHKSMVLFRKIGPQ
ncbi:MAG: hypothetical protein HN742_13005 [Lentisphaerae bacterium]|jgi:uncharacterized membrane protein|nr:hypothetical protein [Lentisphaerota bacterium]MBT5608595.1 hypothetical protein [Lentisphaerota bacterium]MBT7054942.1 hypothetical protein [Lentisphaerota bacterium]MBT7842789.1 hypothetical protein [Lentisphaerota bacterium]